MERALMVIRGLRLCRLSVAVRGTTAQRATHTSGRRGRRCSALALRTTAEAKLVNTTMSGTGNQRPANQRRFQAGILMAGGELKWPRGPVFCCATMQGGYEEEEREEEMPVPLAAHFRLIVCC